MTLKIRELTNFPRGAALRGTTRAATLTKSAFIDFAELKGPEIELKLHRPAGTGKLSIRVSAVFQEKGNREFELSFPSLDKNEEVFQNRVASLTANLAVAQQNLTAAQNELSIALNTTPRNFEEKSALERRILELRKLVTKLRGQVQGLEREIPTQQARVAAVPSMREFLGELHQNARVRFAICATSRDKEIVLAESE